ncbi:hypothetical protein AAMO2058_000064000 [Amorphochlora amoebiformis]
MGLTTSAPDSNLITALVVSDTHDDLKGLERIKKIVQDKKLNIDVVLCPGDITTMPNADWKIKPDPEKVREYSTRVSRVLQILNSIPNHRGKVFWVPGNHDPLPLFRASEESPQEDSKDSKNFPGNVHGKVVEIAPGLLVGGFGGCVEAIENGKEVWVAYPYSEKDMPARMKRFLGGVESSLQKGKTSLILLTHAGPDGSSTAQVSGLDPNALNAPGVRSSIINSGSKAIADMVSTKMVQNSCLVLMHGHTHQGMGLARLGSVPILNPGSTLHSGSFGIVKFQRSDLSTAVEGKEKDFKPGSTAFDKRGPWRLVDTEIHFL